MNTITGNPCVFDNHLVDSHDTEISSLISISATNTSENEKFSICGKNLFHWAHPSKTGWTNNNVTFHYDADGTYRIDSDGCTTTTISAGTVAQGFNLESTRLKNNTGYATCYHNCHFSVPNNTIITISLNCSEEQYYDTKIRALLLIPYDDIDDVKTRQIGYDGYTFMAKSGIEYGIRLMIVEGWKGHVTLKPQIEIGPNITPWELCQGYFDLPISLIANQNTNENIFELVNKYTNKLFYAVKEGTDGYAKIKFNYEDSSVDIEADNISSYQFLVNPDYNDDEFYNTFNYLFKFSFPEDTYICIPAIPKEYQDYLQVQLSEGTYIRPNTILRKCLANTTYAYRLRILPTNHKISMHFKPIIYTGLAAIKYYLSGNNSVTSIYTNNAATLTINYIPPTDKDIINKADDIYKSINILTSGKYNKPFEHLKTFGPHVTFIDDDTSNLNYVQDYKACFDEIKAEELTPSSVQKLSNIVGNYAVEIDNVESEGSSLLNTLKKYEQEGYGMCYHCYSQRGDAGRYWEANNPIYNENLIRANFYEGIRKIKEMGFINYKNWVTPYGVNDEFIRSLAKEAGLNCLISCPAGYTPNSSITLSSNVKRYNIPRIILYQTDPTGAVCKEMIDSAIETDGWTIIVTHVNSWNAGGYTAMRNGFKGLIRYAYTNGVKITNFAYSYETFKPLFLLNELF